MKCSIINLRLREGHEKQMVKLLQSLGIIKRKETLILAKYKGLAVKKTL